MDDYNVSTLNEARNEYTQELFNRLSPLIYQGIYSLFKDSLQLCRDNDQEDKYLMTFQNVLGRIPKWNPDMIERETKRILEQSKCPYLEELISCIHIIVLKNLTSIRVGTKNKKIDIDIPSLSLFIHRVYIEIARKIYKNVYLFDIYCSGLEKQKHKRECELMIQESILNAIRQSMPIERILRTYLEETREEHYIKEESKEVKGGHSTPELSNSTQQSTPDLSNSTQQSTPDLSNSTQQSTPDLSNSTQQSTPELSNSTQQSTPELSNSTQQSTPNTNTEVNNVVSLKDKNEEKQIEFNDTDKVIDFNRKDKVTKVNKTNEENVEAPKTIERLEEIGRMRELENTEDDDDEERIKILDDDKIPFDDLGIETIEPKENNKNDNTIELDDIEPLE